MIGVFDSLLIKLRNSDWDSLKEESERLSANGLRKYCIMTGRGAGTLEQLFSRIKLAAEQIKSGHNVESRETLRKDLRDLIVESERFIKKLVEELELEVNEDLEVVNCENLNIDPTETNDPQRSTMQGLETHHDEMNLLFPDPNLSIENSKSETVLKANDKMNNSHPGITETNQNGVVTKKTSKVIRLTGKKRKRNNPIKKEKRTNKKYGDKEALLNKMIKFKEDNPETNQTVLCKRFGVVRSTFFGWLKNSNINFCDIGK